MSSIVEDAPADRLSGDLFAVIASEHFPCVGAKSALARGTLRTVVCRSMQSDREDFRIHAALLEWVRSYRTQSAGLRSLAIIFQEPMRLSEREFEVAMWARLQSIADEDHCRGQSYANGVSADPENPDFALSFGEEPFFVVGLHPNASRPARRTPRPTLIFNLHDQFERLRREGLYERMRARIIERDVSLAGNANPMLGRFGEASAARQYSGRAVGQDWHCPFRDPRTN